MVKFASILIEEEEGGIVRVHVSGSRHDLCNILLTAMKGNKEIEKVVMNVAVAYIDKQYDHPTGLPAYCKKCGELIVGQSSEQLIELRRAALCIVCK